MWRRVSTELSVDTQFLARRPQLLDLPALAARLLSNLSKGDIALPDLSLPSSPRPKDGQRW
jgi:hypothetical protein